MTTYTGLVLPAEAAVRDLASFALFRVHFRLAMIEVAMSTTSPRFNSHAPAPGRGIAGRGQTGMSR